VRLYRVGHIIRVAAMPNQYAVSATSATDTLLAASPMFTMVVTPDTPRAFVRYEHLMIRDRLPANEVRYCHNLPWFAMVHPVTGGTGVPL
jgi:hypothetical protein